MEVSSVSPLRLLQFSSDDSADSTCAIDLRQLTVVNSQGSQPLNIDEWPVLIFLKGFGCSRIQFLTKDLSVIDSWASRILNYEQIYLADPDSLKITECHWNETDPVSGQALIQCDFEQVEPQLNRLQRQFAVPPMEGPLGISESAVQSFISEIRTESPNDTLSRFVWILHEYRQSALIQDPAAWTALVADIIAVCLENNQLNKAEQIADQHRESLTLVWSQSDRLARLLSSYDPKVFEIRTWMKIFETLPSVQLIERMESLLATSAGPQTLKLISSRVHQNAEEIIEICFRVSPSLQKILLQWLLPQWRPAHFDRILINLKKSFENSAERELQRLWILALIRSSSRNAFDELREHFKTSFPFWGKRSRNKTIQRVIIEVIAENQNSEAREFIKSIRKNLATDLVALAESIIQRRGDWDR